MSEEAHGFQPILPFDTNDSEFCRGFEAGRLWEMLKLGEPFEQEFHASNAEMVLRMAETAETPYRAEILDATWMHGYFGEGWESPVDA